MSRAARIGRQLAKLKEEPHAYCVWRLVGGAMVPEVEIMQIRDSQAVRLVNYAYRSGSGWEVPSEEWIDSIVSIQDPPARVADWAMGEYKKWEAES